MIEHNARIAFPEAIGLPDQVPCQSHFLPGMVSGRKPDCGNRPLGQQVECVPVAAAAPGRSPGVAFRLKLG
ncbi:MAG: hypothetical protein OXC07_10995 [Kistimonas sp.]|nr:hypothetical protein [Kistimonas sp.]